jgi:hypothetical protein
VVIWLNGPFGVGKTTVATLLAARVPPFGVHDPERFGALLQRTIGLVRPGDFQQLHLWRLGTIRAVARRSAGGRGVIVPMTVLDPAIRTELLDGLRRRGRDVLHVTLHASPAVLAERIEQDTDDPGARAWRTRQLARYEELGPQLAEHGPVVDTDGLSPDEVMSRVRGLIVEEAG